MSAPKARAILETSDGGHATLDMDGMTVRLGRSPVDGTFVVEIEGPQNSADEDAVGPRLRLYINEECVYENPPYPGMEE